MNNPQVGARLTLHSREQIIARVSASQRAAGVAAAIGVLVRTPCASGWPARVAGRLAETTNKVILHLRRTLRMTAAAIATPLGLARSAVTLWLARAGLGLLARIDPPEPVRRYQRERPGEATGRLIHLDIQKLGRFDHPGHR